MKKFVCAMLIISSNLFATSENVINEVIHSVMKEKSIPGIAVAYFDGQHEVFYNFGLADVGENIPVASDTIFAIASITKVFTSTQLAIEVLRGRMNLKDSVVKYLPALKNNRLALEQITLQDLATHTSSLPRIPPPRKQGYNHQKVIQFLRNWNPSYPIGTKYLYSNLAFGVLGIAEGNAEKMDYMDLIRRDILTPLYMHSTMISVPTEFMKRYARGYDKDGGPAPHFALNAWPAGGALRSTPSDMMKFMLANLNLRGPEELRKAMQLAQQGIFEVNEHLTMGLGWQRFKGRGLLFVDKNGGVEGFSSYIGMVPDKRMGIVLLANKAKTQLTEVGREILAKIIHEQQQMQKQQH